jgi:hypothetical protein
MNFMSTDTPPKTPARHVKHRKHEVRPVPGVITRQTGNFMFQILYESTVNPLPRLPMHLPQILF